MIYKLYDIKEGKFEYMSYRSQDFFFNSENKVKTYKDSAGSLKIVECKENTQNCKTSTGISFIKKIISEKEPDETRINGLLTQNAKSWLFNINRNLIEDFLTRTVDKLALPENYLEYTDPFRNFDFKDNDLGQFQRIEASEETWNRNFLLQREKIEKVSRNLKTLKEDLENNIITLEMEVLSYNLKNLMPEAEEPYAILYILQLHQKNKGNKFYEERPGLKNIKIDKYIKINDIWNNYKISDGFTYSDFKEVLKKILKNNRKFLIENNFPEEYQLDYALWNFAKSLKYNKKDKIFLEYLKRFNNKKNSVWSTLDKTYAIQNNIIILETRKLKEYKKLKEILGLSTSKKIFYDTIKKIFIIPIHFSKDLYEYSIEYLQNVIDAWNLDILCSDLYKDIAVANLTNKSVIVLNSDFKVDPEANKEEVLLSEESSQTLNCIANPFNTSRSEYLIGVEIPNHIRMEIKRNPYMLGYKKAKVSTNKHGEIVYQENTKVNELIGIRELPYIETNYIGKRIAKQYNLLKEINKRLKKNNKKLIKNIPNNLLNLIFANFALAAADLTLYNTNVISKDFNTKRDFQSYYMASEVRSLIIKRSISQFLKNSEISQFKDQEEFVKSINILRKYETALAIYKAINECFLNLEKLKITDDRVSAADISLSYELNYQKVKLAFSKLKGINTESYISKNESSEWAKDLIDSLDKQKLKELKTSVNTLSYRKIGKIALAIRSCFQLQLGIFIILIDHLKFKILKSNLFQKLLDLNSSLSFYPPPLLT